LLIAYITLSFAGKISASRQVTIAELAVIVIGVMAIVILIQPGALSNVQEFGLGGLVSVKMKNKLQDLENTQENQTKDLDDLRFTTNLLVTDLGRKQLENLATGSTSKYDRNELLQDELRRLRGLGLIKSKRNIREMPPKFDLSECLINDPMAPWSGAAPGWCRGGCTEMGGADPVFLDV